MDREQLEACVRESLAKRDRARQQFLFREDKYREADTVFVNEVLALAGYREAAPAASRGRTAAGKVA